jgi:hypothetical protein
VGARRKRIGGWGKRDLEGPGEPELLSGVEPWNRRMVRARVGRGRVGGRRRWTWSGQGYAGRVAAESRARH